MGLAILVPKPGETVRGIVRVVAETQLPVSFAIDGEVRGTDSTASSAFLWHTERFSNGGHRLEATVDLGDGEAQTAQVDVVVDNTPAPEPQPPLVRPPTVWDEDGVFVNDPSTFSPHLHAEWAWAAGFRWVAPRIQDGETYEYSAGTSKADRAERFGRSRRFLAALRAVLPTIPVALSTFGRGDRHDLDWAAWIQDGAHFLPQAYSNVASELEVGLCVDGAARCLSSPASWTHDRVHPTVNTTGEGSGPVPPAKYAAELAAARVGGFSVYLGEVMAEADYRALGEAAGR